MLTEEQLAVLPEKARMHVDHALFWLARDDGYSSDRHGLARARLKDILYLACELANALLANQQLEARCEGCGDVYEVAREIADLVEARERDRLELEAWEPVLRQIPMLDEHLDRLYDAGWQTAAIQLRAIATAWRTVRELRGKIEGAR